MQFRERSAPALVMPILVALVWTFDYPKLQLICAGPPEVFRLQHYTGSLWVFIYLA